MTLDSTVFPLAAYAAVFQTILYLALPMRLRTRIAPLVTGAIGAGVAIVAAAIFGLDKIGLGATPISMVVLAAFMAALGTAIVAVLMMSRPQLLRELADPRLASMSRGHALAQILVRIPVFTALIEEAFFRGVLHAALVALYPPTVALWLGAGLFGAWHIGPGIDQAQAGGKERRASTVHTVGTFVAMTFCGAFLVWLRMVTGSIWVPVAVHAAVNMTMATFARRAASTQLVSAPAEA